MLAIFFELEKSRKRRREREGGEGLNSGPPYSFIRRLSSHVHRKAGAVRTSPGLGKFPG